MACKVCGSENLISLDGELSASFPSVKAVDFPPVYVCPKVLVCLDCGFAELIVPKKELESLKKASAALNS